MERMNVQESWPLYDTLFVTSTYFGQENDSLNWYNTMLAFSQQERHSFFNQRTEGTAGLQYTNKQSADTLDFAYHAYSIGVSFFSPGVRTLGNLNIAGDDWETIDSTLAHFWEVELPRHCALSLRVQQDIVIELPCFAAPPGYGPCGGGSAFEHEQVGRIQPNGTTPNGAYWPVMNASVTSGVPIIQNRFKFNKAIEIPRTATIEGILTVSEIARATLAQMQTQNYILNPEEETDNPVSHPARFGIQVSLLGKREVQQRAQYHV